MGMNQNINPRTYSAFFKEYPDIVTINDIRKMLGIGSKKAYELVRDGSLQPIPCSKKILVAKITVINYVLKNSQF